MKTNCTLNINGFRFTVTGTTEKGHSLTIEYKLPWGEEVIAYGTLVEQQYQWVLEDMTFENAHQDVILAHFFVEIYKIKAEAYPEAVKYYEANRQPDIFEAIDNLKKAI